MRSIRAVAFLCLFAVGAALGADDASAHRPQERLKPLLKIDWRRGPDLPQGFQDSDGGFIGEWLVSVAGFCSGRGIDHARKPGRYPRGFLDKVWNLDTAHRTADWQPLPKWPGEARQGLFSAVVDEAIYLWGGFSYSDPYCYANGFRLSRIANRWKWDTLPALPYPLAAAAIGVIGRDIYLVGGADYDAERFYTETNRAGKVRRLGARLWVLNTRDLGAGWKELPQLPGTPRWVHAAAAVKGKLYVIGGATGDRKDEKLSYGYCTVVDNWRYDPPSKEWSRLRDLPISSGNFPKSSNLVYGDRYLVLPGGHPYAWVANPDGTVRPKYGEASSFRRESGLHNDCFVYDTQTGLFGSADKLPIDNNLPMTVVRGDEIYLLGGETGGGEIDGVWYGHHPDLLLIGKITEVRP